MEEASRVVVSERPPTETRVEAHTLCPDFWVERSALDIVMISAAKRRKESKELIKKNMERSKDGGPRGVEWALDNDTSSESPEAMRTGEDQRRPCVQTKLAGKPLRVNSPAIFIFCRQFRHSLLHLPFSAPPVKPSLARASLPPCLTYPYP